VGFTTGSRAEVPGKKKRKPVTRNDDDDDDNNNNKVMMMITATITITEHEDITYGIKG
jgi:hypothetical protein